MASPYVALGDEVPSQQPYEPVSDAGPSHGGVSSSQPYLSSNPYPGSGPSGIPMRELPPAQTSEVLKRASYVRIAHLVISIIAGILTAIPATVTSAGLPVPIRLNAWVPTSFFIGGVLNMFQYVTTLRLGAQGYRSSFSVASDAIGEIFIFSSFIIICQSVAFYNSNGLSNAVVSLWGLAAFLAFLLLAGFGYLAFISFRLARDFQRANNLDLLGRPVVFTAVAV